MARKKKNLNWIDEMVKNVNNAKKKSSKSKINLETFFDDLDKECYYNFYDENTNYNQPKYKYTLSDKNGNIIKQWN